MEEAVLTAEIAELARFWHGAGLPFTGPVSEEEIALAERELGIAFPRSYRCFLRAVGSGHVFYFKILGLGSATIRDDVVAVNQLAADRLPPRCLKITETVGGYTFYLDVSRRDASGESPVVVFGPEAKGRVVADSFLDFLHRSSAGLWPFRKGSLPDGEAPDARRPETTAGAAQLSG